MKIQYLAVIFIIIVLPISIVLSSYVQNQVKTLQLQISYDSKLQNATYDALKAFQLNTINSSTSNIANSKLRDIEASANTFFNSVSSNFNMAGYNKDVLKDFVPALVYTMYDGFYIYSPFTNTLTDEDYFDPEDPKGKPTTNPTGETLERSTYVDGEKLSGLKPYIHYSCRYKTENIDVVITYSLDNYITVEGTVDGNPIYDSGYVINSNNIQNDDGSLYRNVPILQENLEEYEYSEEDNSSNIDYIDKVQYHKINGVKYYNDNGKWYSIINGEKAYMQGNTFDQSKKDKSGQNYYKEAKRFSNETLSKIAVLTMENAVDENDEPIFPGDGRNIFNNVSNGVSIEEPESNFNQHRLEVIKRVIQKNLSLAIANYNDYFSMATYDPAINFQMPELKENEWEQIINNVSIISFLQGLNIGGKIYNGYSIVINDKNEEVVKEESIYLLNGDGSGSSNTYYKITANNLASEVNSSDTWQGVFNIDFEKKKIDIDKISPLYYFPKLASADYNSIVNSNYPEGYDGDVYKYLDKLISDDPDAKTLASLYYTALGRERYSMYKASNNAEAIKADYY